MLFLVTSRAFVWAIIALILINTVLLAIEHYNMDKTVSDMLSFDATISFVFPSWRRYSSTAT